VEKGVDMGGLNLLELAAPNKKRRLAIQIVKKRDDMNNTMENENGVQITFGVQVESHGHPVSKGSTSGPFFWG